MAQKKTEERKKKLFRAQGALDNAPSSNKCRYLKLPPGLRLLVPEAGTVYKLVFIPWVAGKGNSTGKAGADLVWNRYMRVHRRIGPDETHHICALAEFSKPCAVCELHQQLKRTAPRDDKEYWKNILSPLLAKDREIMLVHDMNNTKDDKNLFVWDESVHLFGDAFRALYKRKEKWMSFADLEDGCVVEIEARKKTIGSNSCVDMTQAIVIEPRDEPLPEWLVKASEKFCLDDYVVATPYSELKKLIDQTGGEGESKEEEDEDQEPAQQEVEEEVEEDKPEEPEEEKPVRRPSSKKKAEPEPEDDDDDEDDEDEDDESEPEDDDEAEDEEDRPKKTPPRRPAPRRRGAE